MKRDTFFQELRRVLQRVGFTTQAERDSLLPVEWDGHPLCRITEGGGVRYRQEDVATLEREQACEQATHLAGTVREYMTLLEQAPPLRAQGLTGDFRVLADFNGTVLAGHQTKFGIHFVTWDRDFRWTGLNYGHYFQDNYLAAKQDFAIRSGLVPQTRCCRSHQRAGTATRTTLYPPADHVKLRRSSNQDSGAFSISAKGGHCPCPITSHGIPLYDREEPGTLLQEMRQIILTQKGRDTSETHPTHPYHSSVRCPVSRGTAWSSGTPRSAAVPRGSDRDSRPHR